MKLRFKVDQVDCFRNGIDCPKSIITVEVNPADLSQEDRNLLADRMFEIDVCPLIHPRGSCRIEKSTTDLGKKEVPDLIIAERPTFDSLMDAVRKNEARIAPIRKRLELAQKNRGAEPPIFDDEEDAKFERRRLEGFQLMQEAEEEAQRGTSSNAIK